MGENCKIGKGSNGSIYDIGNNTVVKKLVKNNNDFISSIRELSIMLQTYQHPFIVEFKNYKYLKENIKFDNIEFYLEKADMDLHSKMTKENNKNYLDYKNFMFEILLSVKYLHDLNIIHRDIKPENILIFENDSHYGKVAKLTDFGMAINYAKGAHHTPFVTSSRYKSPEICLGSTKYGLESDIWALGITFFEMISNKEYFPVSCKELNNIEEIKKECDDILFKIVSRNPIIDENLKEFVKLHSIKKTSLTKNRTPFKKKLGLNSIKIKLFEFETNSSFDDFCDLIENMLKISPKERYNIDQCLSHNFFSGYNRNFKVDTFQIDNRIILPNPKIRKVMSIYMYDLFLKKKKLFWLKNEGYLEYRIIFQAINIFDRYSLNFDILKNKDIIMHVILYICFKFFNCMGESLSIKDVIGIDLDNKTLSECYKLEKKILDILIDNGYIYCDTIYEFFVQKGLNIKDLNRIFIIYINNNSISGLTPHEFYDIYLKKNVSNIPIEELDSIIF